MKAKTIILIILCSIFLGCSTKRKAVSFSKEGKTEIEKIKIDSTAEKKIEKKHQEQSAIKSEKQKEEIKSDVSIQGKTDSLTPFQYHNVVNGDTLQSISIFGKADFKINNHFNKSSEKAEEKKESEKLNIVQELARKSVAKSTINEVASQVKKVDKQIKERSFTFGAWFTWSLWFVVIACLVWLLIYFGKGGKLVEMFKKFKKKEDGTR